MATVVGLLQVTPIAQKVVQEEGAADRVEVITADVIEHSLEGSYDAAVLRNVLQVLSRVDAQKILLNVSKGINPGGTIYIVGQFM